MTISTMMLGRMGPIILARVQQIGYIIGGEDWIDHDSEGTDDEDWIDYVGVYWLNDGGENGTNHEDIGHQL